MLDDMVGGSVVQVSSVVGAGAMGSLLGVSARVVSDDAYDVPSEPDEFHCVPRYVALARRDGVGGEGARGGFA